MKTSNDVEKITVSFTDGTEKVIQKGFVCSEIEKDSTEHEKNYYFLFANISGRELRSIFEAVILCAFKLGFINDDEAEDE